MSRLLAPGGFTAVLNIASPFGVDDPFCTFCAAADPAWLHLASSRVVCRYCLPNPHADEGEAGRRAERMLTEINGFPQKMTVIEDLSDTNEDDVVSSEDNEVIQS